MHKPDNNTEHDSQRQAYGIKAYGIENGKNNTNEGLMAKVLVHTLLHIQSNSVNKRAVFWRYQVSPQFIYFIIIEQNKDDVKNNDENDS